MDGLKKISLLLLPALLTACQAYDFDVPETSQEFAAGVSYSNKVDILMMIDNSSSMDVYQNKLADQIPAMISALDRLGMDYNIAVTTSDMRAGYTGGKFVGSPKIIRSSTSNRSELLKTKIKAGNAGSAVEQGFASLMAATSTSYLSNDGAGFLREGAPLVLMVLTNEDDWSSASAQDFVSHFDNLKTPFASGDRSWFLNFLGVTDVNGPCSSAMDGVYKEAGTKYMEVATLTKGRIESVCQSSLTTAMSNIQKRIVEILTDYSLGRRPKLETLKIYINGVLVPQNNVNGWEYIEQGFLIRFHGEAVPTATDRIAITFDPAEGS